LSLTFWKIDIQTSCSVCPPTNLVTNDVTDTSFVASWTAAPGNVKMYRVRWKSLFSEEAGEKTVAGDVTNTVLDGLTPETLYQVSVVAAYGHKDSEPLAGQETTDERKNDPEERDLCCCQGCVSLTVPSLLIAALSAETQCKTKAKADIVLLVDGSWSIGRINFKTIRNFIASMVSVFDISPDTVQIGLAQYSGDPRTEWHLNTHPTKESLMKAIENLPYKGGNTMTGLALNFILQNNFRPNGGMREDARKIGVLITDGKSQDEIIMKSQSLRESGIELYAIGVKNADENELRSIATDPDEIHMYNVNDFQFLLTIVDDLTNNLMHSTEQHRVLKAPHQWIELEVPEAPTNLVTSEVTHRSFRATWTPPGRTVDMYKVTYTAVDGGATQELLVDGSVTTTVLEGLTPLTEYVVNVYSVYDELISEPLKGTETTLPRPPAGVLRISDVTHSTMRLNWDAAPGAVRKYIINYKPEEGDLKEVKKKKI
uniref:Collagen, type XII, alpha 1b n=1 Tax=Labrus bergylta TaxID=56723 RepID=A0A3Q3NC05_9LABR